MAFGSRDLLLRRGSRRLGQLPPQTRTEALPGCGHVPMADDPVDPLPVAFRAAALVNPITWHVDVMRFATIGLGDPRSIALEAAGFMTFTLVSFAGALHVLRREG